MPSPIRMVGLWTIAAALAEASAAARAWRASAAYVCAVEAAESVGSFGSSECLALTCLSSVTLGCRRSTSALGGALRINLPAQGGESTFIDQEQPKTAHDPGTPKRGPQAGSNPFSYAQFMVRPRGSVRYPTSSQ